MMEPINVEIQQQDSHEETFAGGMLTTCLDLNIFLTPQHVVLEIFHDKRIWKENFRYAS